MHCESVFLVSQTRGVPMIACNVNRIFPSMLSNGLQVLWAQEYPEVFMFLYGSGYSKPRELSEA